MGLDLRALALGQAINVFSDSPSPSSPSKTGLGLKGFVYRGSGGLSLTGETTT